MPAYIKPEAFQAPYFVIVNVFKCIQLLLGLVTVWDQFTFYYHISLIYIISAKSSCWDICVYFSFHHFHTLLLCWQITSFTALLSACSSKLKLKVLG